MYLSTLVTTLSAAGLALGASTGKPSLRASALILGHEIEAHVGIWGYTDKTPSFVQVQVIKGLFNNELGPYLYHVHTNPVGQERNCTTALGHLDPLQVTDSLVCDPAFPQYCQEGDLSGKKGKLNGTESGAIDTFSYTADYLRFFPEDFSILGRSIVIHSANKTRLACGDIISTLDGTAYSSGQPTYSPSTYVTNYPTAPYPNPPQVVTPFVGEKFPNDETLHNLPFALANPGTPISESLNVVLTVETQTVWINGSQTQAQLPVENPSSDAPPFEATADDGTAWPWSS